MQNELDLSGSYLLLYADLLDEILQEVFPDNLTPPGNVFRVARAWRHHAGPHGRVLRLQQQQNAREP